MNPYEFIECDGKVFVKFGNGIALLSEILSLCWDNEDVDVNFRDGDWQSFLRLDRDEDGNPIEETDAECPR